MISTAILTYPVDPQAQRGARYEHWLARSADRHGQAEGPARGDQGQDVNYISLDHWSRAGRLLGKKKDLLKQIRIPSQSNKQLHKYIVQCLGLVLKWVELYIVFNVLTETHLYILPPLQTITEAYRT